MHPQNSRELPPQGRPAVLPLTGPARPSEGVVSRLPSEPGPGDTARDKRVPALGVTLPGGDSAKCVSRVQKRCSARRKSGAQGWGWRGAALRGGAGKRGPHVRHLGSEGTARRVWGAGPPGRRGRAQVSRSGAPPSPRAGGGVAGSGSGWWGQGVVGRQGLGVRGGLGAGSWGGRVWGRGRGSRRPGQVWGFTE